MVQIRSYRDGDEKGIISLFNRVFDTERKEEYWNWQFMENPAKKPILIVAEDDSKIVGQCSLLPTNMLVNDGIVLAGQSIDTMVDEEYRGQKLHVEMAKKSYERAREEGLAFRTGFPSQDALRGLLGSLGGSLVTEIPIYISIYDFSNLALSLVKFKPLSKIISLPFNLILKLRHREKRIKSERRYDFKEISEFTEDFDRLWEKLKKDRLIMTERTSSFLNWRIKDHPTINYKTIAAYCQEELVGYMIVKKEERKLRGKYQSSLGSIVDMVGLDEEVVSLLYSQARAYFKREKTDFIVCWGSDSMTYRDLLVKRRFFKSRSTIPFVVKDLTRDRALEDIITDEKNWYLMPIESDFY